MFIVLGFSFWGLIRLGSSQNSGTGDVLSASVTNSDWHLGPEIAPITIVEYGDFQCPACALYEPMLRQAVSEFGSNLRFVYRNFPLRQIHANAQISAQAAGAAGAQSAFWKMHDMLFNNQKEWSSSMDPKSIFAAYVKDLGLNVEQFNKDLNSDKVKEKIDSDYRSGLDSKVNSTPTFFVNGEKMKNPQNYDQLKEVISRYVRK